MKKQGVGRARNSVDTRRRGNRGSHLWSRGEGHTRARPRTKPRRRVSAPSWLRVLAARHVTAQASVSPRVKAGSGQTRQSERSARSENHRGPRPPQVNFPAAPRGWGSRPRASSRGGQACPHRPPSPTRHAALTPVLAEAAATYRARIRARADSGSLLAAREAPRGAGPRVVTQGAEPLVITPLSPID